MKKTVAKFSFLVILALLLTISCSKNTSSNQSATANYTEYVVSRQNLLETLSLSGTLYARNSVDILPLVTGVVKKVYVSKGDSVKAGDVLFEIDETEYKLSYIKALQNYENAKLTGSKLLLEQRELELQIAKRDLERCIVRSPIDGVVVSINVKEGYPLTSGTSSSGSSSSIATVVGTDSFYVAANVDEIDYSKVSVGQNAVVTVDALSDLRLLGRVSYISREAETSSGIVVVPIEIDLLSDSVQRPSESSTASVSAARQRNVTTQTSSPNAPTVSAAQQQSQRKSALNALIPGLSCQVEIILVNKPNVIVVPTRAVQIEDGQTYVTVKTGDETEKRIVKVGERTSSSYEIIEGLNEGEIVIVPTIQRTSSGNQTMQNPVMFIGPAGGAPPR